MIYLLSQTIDRIAEHSPQAEAFRFQGQSLSYARLVRQANALAHTLQACGVRRGDRVGIYLQKCLESAVAIYGIWKAGAAYVPLDPTAPLQRLEFICRSCDLSCLISQPEQRERTIDLVARVPQLRTIVGLAPQDLHTDSADTRSVEAEAIPWASIRASATDWSPKLRLLGGDLAYVMYTSGSTGEPKGIKHTHQSGLSYAMMAAETYDLERRDRLGNFAPLHFDQSTLEYFAGPLVGATTVIIPELHTKFPASLSQLVQDERLTIWYSVPFALIHLLLRGALEKRDLSSLRWVLFGGEPFPPKYLHALMKMLPQAHFSNIYGPAEVNQCTYYHVPRRSQWQSTADVPIGQIWENAEAWVMDAHGEPVAPGAVGELWVRTPTMMSGYWQRPDLDAKVFCERELPGEQRARTFRTGDLVRQQPDGNYQFIGRQDRQVKVRGFRIELDEVEAAIIAHNLVLESAAFTVELDTGSQQLEAAIVLQPEATLSPAELRRFLSSRLPGYAIPTRITKLDGFPRTASDKTDRRALQEKAQQRVNRDRAG